MAPPAESAPLDLDLDFAAADDGLVAALRVSLPPDSIAYSHDETQALPLRLRRIAGPAGEVFYPVGEARRDKLDPSRRVQALEGSFPLFLRFSAAPAAGESLALELSLLLCSSRNCRPLRQMLERPWPDVPPPLDQVPWAEDYVAARRALSPEPLEAAPALSPAAPAVPSGVSESLGPRPSGPGEAVPFPGRAFVPRPVQAALEPGALGMALLLGLLAGCILNVMPCVLPVLTIKISGLLAVSGESDSESQRRRLREHALLFSAGILTCFGVLALCAGSLGVAWGGLFQHSELVCALLVLVFLLGLSLFDVFSLPVLDLKAGASANPKMQAYTSGLVATFLATPCSGPLLGGVLTWALARPLPIILAVFLTTGLGMALPYLLLAARPGLARILPRPGPWTGVVERLTGFFLMGTAIYLLSILPEGWRLSALCLLLVCALGAWIWGRWGGPQASTRQRLLAGLLALSLVGGVAGWMAREEAPSARWIPFDPASFTALLGKETLLVEFTADWCPSCKVLERSVLTPDRLRSLSEDQQIRLMRVDLTRPNPDAEALLRATGNASIPATVIFPRGLLSASPLVLRDLYTSALLDQALALLPSPAAAPFSPQKKQEGAK